jgi:L-alanine-DL-glutamate epimerase-like enolase superfamily enzyme
MGEQEPPKGEIVKTTIRIEDGYLIRPKEPGIGNELAEGAQEKYLPKPREVHSRLNVDGSVVDQ